jgi:hypothetical protein
LDDYAAATAGKERLTSFPREMQTRSAGKSDQFKARALTRNRSKHHEVAKETSFNSLRQFFRD